MTQAPPPRYFKEGGKREAQVMNQLALQGSWQNSKAGVDAHSQQGPLIHNPLGLC